MMKMCSGVTAGVWQGWRPSQKALPPPWPPPPNELKIYTVSMREKPKFAPQENVLCYPTCPTISESLPTEYLCF